MVIKAKSDVTIQPLKNVSDFNAWQFPSLDGGDRPGFRQPVEDIEEEPELTPAEIEQQQVKERQKIKDEAYQEGFKLGQSEGLEAAREQIARQTSLMEKLINELAEPLKQCGEKTQQQLLQLAFSIARQIVRRELQQDPTQLIAVIRDSLNLLPIGNQAITILLHPEDAEIIKEKLFSMAEDTAVVDQSGQVNSDAGSELTECSWQIRPDPAIEQGGCQVVTNNSRINASIDQQVAVLFSKIVGGLREGEREFNAIGNDEFEVNGPLNSETTSTLKNRDEDKNE